MSDATKYEKPPPTAPPPYPDLYPTGNTPSGPPQYGFQTPSQPLPGYMPYPQTTQPVSVNQQLVVALGGCPSCRVGVLEDNYTCCGILCAICFFPLGILCCLAMKEKKCTNCNATF